MSRTVEYFFSLASPWAYIGFKPFRAIVERHRLEVAYKPVGLGFVFDRTGGLPLGRRHPARQRYRMVELQRWRQRRGLDFALSPKNWPFDPTLADRTVIALLHARRDPTPFLALAHPAIWEKEENLADEAVVARLLGEAGVEPAPILAAARGDATEVIYLLNLENAVDKDVFGAPSYVVDGEVYWGQDRLELLDDMLTSGRQAFQAEPAA
ncbi:2-hydroxychromene-2-carboxylate isomerase [Chelatococcus reniformis]|uniref:2-hydroxychromene-2-carboxylate isomerase n=1 Tax=Chelatococcus reniformis TaxID=1494448 RepID=A0A916URM6_9HYPH|nr:2-hydroxychromene-2-carboxylate isomerase [Chelatococcus reniformis]GGC83525.1 2-hydroxychromene-2-carboxylate isomerase [Chelatococcus reniformis]